MEGFGELGKRNSGAEVEVKGWLKYVQERMEGENLETEDIDISSKEVHYKGKERNDKNWSMKLGQERVLSIYDEKNNCMLSC